MKCRILTHELLNSGYYLLRLLAPEIARTAGPGQFVMIKITSSHCDPLLRRPISIMDADPATGVLELLYNVVGKGTQLLSTRNVGDDLDIVGPLGNGFNLDLKHQTTLLVCGGIGTPPMVFLARILAQKQDGPIVVFLGARTAKGIVCEKKFEQYGVIVKIATESGEKGAKGLVTEPLIDFLNDKPPDPILYACGPKPMLKVVSEIGLERKIPTFISLEEHMGCGIGACLGCIVQTPKGPLRVCTEGPVFDVNILGDEW